MLALVNSLIKGVIIMAHSVALISDELSTLRKATKAINNKKTRKRKYVQN